MAVDIEQILADMVQARYPKLRGRVSTYDQAPEAASIDHPVYAIVDVVSTERGYVLAGQTSGRQVANWELTLLGFREAVVEAQEDLPYILTAYYNGADGITVTGSTQVGLQSVQRLNVPQGSAGTVIQFTTEYF